MFRLVCGQMKTRTRPITPLSEAWSCSPGGCRPGLRGLCGCSCGKVGARPWVLDGLLDHFLHRVPIASLNALDVRVEVLLNLHQHLPFRAAGDKRDGDTNAAETTGTTDTVEVRLRIRLALLTRDVKFGNILREM